MTRKESIVEAATRLFAARGFDATSTAEVAKVAGVSEGTIFHHFKTKDGVLFHVFGEMMSLYLEGVRSETQESTNGLDTVERIIRFHFGFIAKYSKESLVIFRDLPSHFLEPGSPNRQMVRDQVAQVFKLLTQAIERGKMDGSIRDVSSEKTAFMVRGLLTGLTRQRLFGPIDIPDLCEDAVEFCRRSLSSITRKLL
jgi:AcrR family transcriptional regulator